jgi:hypothetical protein
MIFTMNKSFVPSVAMPARIQSLPALWFAYSRSKTNVKKEKILLYFDDDNIDEMGLAPLHECYLGT